MSHISAGASAPLRAFTTAIAFGRTLRAPAPPAQPCPGGRHRKGAQPPSESSRQPPLAAAVVLDVAVALPLPDAREPQVELLDVLVLADRPGVAVEDDASVLHHVAVLREPEGHRGV